MQKYSYKGAILESFNFLIVVDILLSTAIAFFMDRSSFLDKYQSLVSSWYVIPIICLILSFVCFQMIGDYLNQTELKRLHKWLLIVLVLNSALLFSSAYPEFGIKYYIFIFFIAFSIAFNFAISFVWILLPLVFKFFQLIILRKKEQRQI